MPEQGIYWVEPAKNVSDLFRQYRERASWMLVLGLLVIAVMLVSRYSLLRGMLVVSIPVCSVAGVLGLMGWLDIPYNLFHFLGMMVVLGIGLDYSIFLCERQDGSVATLAAVSLSAITTILAFGLLSVSRTPAVSAFGTVILTGVVLNVMLSWLLLAGGFSEDQCQVETKGN